LLQRLQLPGGDAVLSERRGPQLGKVAELFGEDDRVEPWVVFGGELEDLGVAEGSVCRMVSTSR
jgi:hypothetical protein